MTSWTTIAAELIKIRAALIIEERVSGWRRLDIADVSRTASMPLRISAFRSFAPTANSISTATENETDAPLLGRVRRAADTVEMLFAAWARYEMEEVRQKDKLFVPSILSSRVRLSRLDHTSPS
jgi:hypothetical protein